jgi:hypothetical protein
MTDAATPPQIPRPRTFQDTFFAVLTERLSALGCALITQPDASNTGTFEVVPAGALAPVLSVQYHFQHRHSVLESPAPVWPEGRKNPRMIIMPGARELGVALDQIVAYAEAATAPAPR